MNGRGAKPLERGQMRSDGVALVLREAISRIGRIELVHEGVAGEYSLLDRWEEAERALRIALQLRRELGDDLSAGKDLRRLSTTLWRLCRGEESGQAAGEAARRKGWTPLMGLTAAISLNLGIFNLLPIPILDGGVIMFLLIEGLMRRDISLRIKERVYQAAFVFLVLFAVMVIYNDLMKTIPGLAERMP